MDHGLFYRISQPEALKMTIIDTHAHIYLPEFGGDETELMARAAGEGVGRILMPAIDAGTHAQMLAMEKRHHSCESMMGLHPCSVKENFRDELKLVQDHLEKRKFVAIGETGLDFYWDLTWKDSQFMSFEQQIEWALHYDRPVVIHSRNSIDECIEVVTNKQRGKLKGVFHCFSGNATQAKQIIDQGFYLGIGGVVTFKNGGLDKVMEDVSLENVVLETDAPYLPPVPFRGKRNEPSYLRYVVEKLMEVKKVPKEEVERISTENAETLFG